MALDNHILTITEPTLKLDEVKYKAYDEEEGEHKRHGEHGEGEAAGVGKSDRVARGRLATLI